MRDNGERIYLGLVEKEPMEKLEEENVQPKEAGFRWERNNSQLTEMLTSLSRKQEEQ